MERSIIANKIKNIDMKRVKHYVGCLLLMVAALSLTACHLDELRGDVESGRDDMEVG